MSLISGDESENPICGRCKTEKVCQESNISKSQEIFYEYTNGSVYNKCKDCFNKQVICEFCNRDFKTYLSKHFKRCLKKNYHSKPVYAERFQHNEPKTIDNTNNIITNNETDEIDNNIHINMNNDKEEKFNRTLILGPSFCGKTYLLINKLKLIRLCDGEKQIKIITRSPQQYTKVEIEEVSVEEDLEDRTIQDYQNCCVVFEDILDSNQKLIDPFFY